MASFTVGLLTAVASAIPQLDPSRQQNQQANTYVYASNGYTVLSILRGSQARVVVPPAGISPWMTHAIVAAEDKRFYEHRGVDLRGMARALWADVTHHGTVQGGSTITQQFVKNAFLTSQKSVGRKLIEAALAWQLEQRWSKTRILTAYLNTVYYGNGAYGVEQASRIYFHHKAKTLNPAEAALLAAIPEDPSAWDPVAHPQAAHDRRDLVLRLLLQQGYLTQSQYNKWVNAPMPNPKDVSLPSTQGVAAPYFANYVKDQLVKKYGPAKTFGGGLKVRTTLNVNLQDTARQAIASVLPQNGNGPTAAMVVLDAQRGDVLAMVGGENYHHSQFNLATQGERQPGSSFKPFVLATALKDNIAPSTVLVSKPVTINTGGRLWKVENYEGEYLGPISLTQAIAYSDNSVFSQLTAIVGPRNVRTTARDLGITSPLAGYFAIGLGAEPATPLEMARAYASFADGGSRVDGSVFGNEPRVVRDITTGKHTEQNGLVAHRVLTPEQAETVNQLLQGVVRYGTGKAAQLPGREVAGKTGTTENYGDAWFVGYTPQYVAAVWVGYPDKLVPMTTEFHGKPVAGGTFPALIWKAFMTKALAKSPPMSFTPPSGGYAAPVTVVNRGGALMRDDGVCTNTIQLEFFAGQGPPHVADCKTNEVDIPNTVGLKLVDARARLEGQPLTPEVVFKPARTGDRIDLVVGQFPARGTASAGDKVTLVLRKSLHNVVPNVVGLALPRAERELAKVKMQVATSGAGRGKVVAQSIQPRTASAPGERIVLTVRGTGG
jgi:penicillin-binding protein 1A